MRSTFVVEKGGRLVLKGILITVLVVLLLLAGFLVLMSMVAITVVGYCQAEEMMEE